MIEEMRKNIEHEKQIVKSLGPIIEEIKINNSDFYKSSVRSLVNQLKILNNTIPALLKEVSPVKPLAEEKASPEIVKISYVSPATKEKKYISVRKEDKGNFIKELQVSEGGISNIKKMKDKQTTNLKPSELAKVASLFFSKVSERIAPRFAGLSGDIKKANIRFLTSTYISISLFISSLVFLMSLIVILIMTAFNFKLIFLLWIPFFALFVSLSAFYLYPATERKGVEKRISQELPFATIHMSAIAGSNVEPTKIFKIIASSSEYPSIGMEIRKLINQTDLYGYDLVTALKNTAMQTSSPKLSEMFNGLATNISTGGSLKNYLEKKAENYLADYRLERERYNDLAGTFMDIYISILITAPLILMMMLVVMNVSGLNIGLSLDTLLILAIAGIVIVNIIFIVALEVKQPKT
jgi:Flp pilus assembly protein TadB